MDSVGRDLTLLAKSMRARFEARLAAVGASVPAWAVLSCAVAEEGLSQRELAERMAIEPATLTRHLDRLEADGLITRRRDPDDRRILRIEATPTARLIHADLALVARRLEDDLLAGLSPAEVAELRRLLTHITANLEERHATAAAR